MLGINSRHLRPRIGVVLALSTRMPFFFCQFFVSVPCVTAVVRDAFRLIESRPWSVLL